MQHGWATPCVIPATKGNRSRRTPNSTSDIAPTRFDTRNVRCPTAELGAARHSQRPAIPPMRIAATCPIEPATKITIRTAARAMLARSRSGARLRAIPQTACATTATATTLRPWISPPPTGPSKAEAPKANKTRSRAEGRVNAAHAANAPRGPPRNRPSANPTWLLAGPGRNWQSATRSA
jgi:hypothetical protein